MDNVTYGLLALGYASLLYYWSWRYQRRNRYDLAIGLMIAGALGLYCYVVADFFLHYWDERYHALVAKNLLDHPLIPTLYDDPVLPYDFRQWWANHIWVHKQPLPLWGMAASMWVFGVNEIAVRIPSVILVAIAIYLVFGIGAYLFDKAVGYLAAFLFSINGLVISMLSGRRTTDHVDVFFLFFILLAIYLSVIYCRNQNRLYTLLIGVSVGLAILSKWLPALIVLPIWAILVWDNTSLSRKKAVVDFGIILVTLTAVFVPWQLYIFTVFPEEAAWESSYNVRHLSEAVEGHAGSIFFYLNQIRINYAEYIYLPLGWFFYRTYRDIDNKKRLALLVWFLVPFSFFSLVATKMQGYLLFSAPALFYMTAEFFHAVARMRVPDRWKWARTAALVLMIIIPVRYSLERLEIFEIRDRNPQWVEDLRILQKTNVHKPAVLFNYANPIEAMFYTDLTAYPQVPDSSTIMAVIGRGYTVMINDTGDLPDAIMGNDAIIKVNLTQRPEQ